MTKAMKARHGGFTLVELLIVIIIIAILAGMLLLATGSATDNAEATKIINDVRNLKAASMMYFVDHDAWPLSAQIGTIEPSLDLYLDRPFLAMDDYTLLIVDEVTIQNQTRSTIGFTKEGVALGVQQKLAGKAEQSGVYGGPTGAQSNVTFTAGTTAGDVDVYMIMR